MGGLVFRNHAPQVATNRNANHQRAIPRFVIVDCRGRYWTGRGWSSRLRDSLLYASADRLRDDIENAEEKLPVIVSKVGSSCPQLGTESQPSSSASRSFLIEPQERKAKPMPSQQQIRQEITKRIVEALESGVKPWRRPFH